MSWLVLMTSFMYNKNRSGQRIIPWGTPHLITLLLNLFQTRSHDTGNDNLTKSLYELALRSHDIGMKWRETVMLTTKFEALILTLMKWNRNGTAL